MSIRQTVRPLNGAIFYRFSGPKVKTLCVLTFRTSHLIYIICMQYRHFYRLKIAFIVHLNVFFIWFKAKNYNF